MNNFIKRIALSGSGMLLGFIGCSLMFAPKAFLASNKVMVVYDSSLMSEMVSPTGILIVTGAFMTLSAVKLKFADIGLLSGAIVYGSYGVSRMISMLLHGLPSEPLIVATLLEIVIALMLLSIRLNASFNAQTFKGKTYDV